MTMLKKTEQLADNVLRLTTPQSTQKKVSLGLAKAFGICSLLIASNAYAVDPDFGPNVRIFDPSMATADIQAITDAAYQVQVNNEMGLQRNAFLFKPGSYGSADKPLIVKVGYNTEVSGLGILPTDVAVNGHVDVYNRCFSANNCIALNNFWRSLSNLTINVQSKGQTDCRAQGNFWAASQASPMRRVLVNGQLNLMDFCTDGPQYASGGYMADVKVNGKTINGSQQQYLVRNSSIGEWSNGVWNQVFSGVKGAPATSFGPTGSSAQTYTTLNQSPVTREKPYVYIDPQGNYQVFVPSVLRNSSDVSWASGTQAGRSLPISQFYIAKPTDTVQTINAALGRGLNLILTPGLYRLQGAIVINRPDTVVLGMGLPTLIPQGGHLAIAVADVPGVMVSGVMMDAGVVNSQVLMQVGGSKRANDQSFVPPSGDAYYASVFSTHAPSNANNPTTLNDVFFRIGGSIPGKATTSLVVNSDHVILDHIWAWRADHGNARTFGWAINQGDQGVVVNSNDVTAYGLFVEHYQKHNVIWRGENGKTIFFQNELPYDPPTQTAWMDGATNGYTAYLVDDAIKLHEAWGMGSYCFFQVNPSIHAAHAFKVPVTPGVKLHSMTTVSLSKTGTIDHIVNNVGDAASPTGPDSVRLVNYVN